MKLKWKYIVIGILIAIVSIICINFLLDWGPFAKYGNGSDDGWLGFWGSIIGVVGAVLIAVWTTNVQLKESKRNDLENAFTMNDAHTIHKMIELTNELYYEILDYKQEIIDIRSQPSQQLREETAKKLKNTIDSVLDNFGVEFNAYRQELSVDIEPINKEWGKLIVKVEQLRRSFSLEETFGLHETEISFSFGELTSSIGVLHTTLSNEYKNLRP